MMIGSSVLNVQKTSLRLACAVREIARFNDHYRDTLQHGGDKKVLGFFKMSSSRLADEVGEVVTRSQEPSEISAGIKTRLWQKFGIDLSPISAYKPERVSVDQLIIKELSRTSNLPCQMVTVIDGSERPLTSDEEEAAFRLGAALAKKGVAVICCQTKGMLGPLLSGAVEGGGLTIGILATGTRANRNLVKILIRSPKVRSIAALTSTMSGRLLIVYKGEKDPITDDCLHSAAYKGIPAILIDTKIPEQAKSPLQDDFSLYDTDKIEEYLESRLFLSPDKTGNFDPQRLPVSYFAGTKFIPEHPDPEYLIEFARLLTSNNYFTISGGGPGPMAIIDQVVSQSTLTVGLCSFPTYLSSNPFSAIPIVGNYEKESRDMMVLSSIASVNLGGSDTTWREVDSARLYGTPLINCNPFSFPSSNIRERGFGKLYTADSPEATLLMLNRIRSKTYPFGL